MSQIEKHEPVTGNADYHWHIEVSESHSAICVEWSTDAPFTPQDANVAIYKELPSKSLPEAPAPVECHWIQNELSGKWLSKTLWGSGYYVTINATFGTPGISTQWTYFVIAGPTVG